MQLFVQERIKNVFLFNYVCLHIYKLILIGQIT